MKTWLVAGAILIVVVAVVFVLTRRETPSPSQVQVPTSTRPMGEQEAYLEKNAKEPGWTTTASGLQYKVLTPAANESAPKPEPGTEVTIHYEGKLIDGKVFDSSYQRGEPIKFPLSQLIQGWQEGVPLMREGEKWEFVIPSKLGYGDRGAPGSIPGGATLIFTIELLKAHTPAK